MTAPFSLRVFPSPVVGTPDAALRQVTRANDNTLREALVLFGIPDVLDVSADVTLTATRQHVQVDASAAAVTVTLPPIADTPEGVVISVKKMNAGSHSVTVAGSGSDTIDGSASEMLSSHHGVINVIATPSGWDVLASHLHGGGGGGGGTTFTTGVATVNFGTFPGASDASVTVTGQTGITATSVVQAWLTPVATADHTADEHRLETLAVQVGDIVAGTGFTIYATNTSETPEPLELAGISTFRSAAATVYGDSSLPSVGGKGTRIYGQWSVRWQWYTP